ncbi:tannase/feruloyl esterase family alpha/beta hydrolase [Novosphingobium aerophilum]|uniref:Tannase/feruloyl esterase family alpha/beta hydrolase n=1 Tax=Novosphingobium aerophilum TaxID=2839843 RepID=A0A7X1F5B4_9SPHN|nr:tannase/feruloyl esterase family alpha/beta hydrolase [Novosphingobium aerophilum]MBC2650514.1 tannase/feruloyl esterase family alpha/beta hydrolase [Novosphingobium aerophilum]
MNRLFGPALLAAVFLPATACMHGQAGSPDGGVTSGDPATRCAALASAMQGRWPGAEVRLISAEYHAAGPAILPPNPMGMPSGPAPLLPEHCELVGSMHERTGVDGQSYAIQFHLRLPAEWNGRFFMQGGGGTNGELGDALGQMGSGPPALAQGYAVLSQDSGHSNRTNSPPEKGGMTSFGMDPQARAEYGGTSLPVTVGAAKALVNSYYGAAPTRSYFVGCSKGGQEGMMLAQRHPALFDGIIAAAPGMSLPRAAIAQAWDTQALAAVSAKPPTPASIASSFSNEDLQLVSSAVLAACDRDDGIADGIVGNFPSCTTAKVKPRLDGLACTGSKDQTCLSTNQIDALVKIHEGPRNSSGSQLYTSFPWDAGWADFGWRIWKMGSPDGSIPSLNVAMGAPALAQIFTTQPTLPGLGLQGSLNYALGFDFDQDAAKIYARDGLFLRSAWDDIGARSPDIAAFAALGHKMIVPHGVSDPAFSVKDTTAWWDETNTQMGGNAANTVRVFPVPGMGHCSGGPATSDYDAFSALVEWVEQGRAPDTITARSTPNTPWPNRSRPLCPWPKIAHYVGTGSAESADSFECR